MAVGGRRWPSVAVGGFYRLVGIRLKLQPMDFDVSPYCYTEMFSVFVIIHLFHQVFISNSLRWFLTSSLASMKYHHKYMSLRKETKVPGFVQYIYHLRTCA